MSPHPHPSPLCVDQTATTRPRSATAPAAHWPDMMAEGEAARLDDKVVVLDVELVVSVSSALLVVVVVVVVMVLLVVVELSVPTDASLVVGELVAVAVPFCEADVEGMGTGTTLVMVVVMMEEAEALLVGL